MDTRRIAVSVIGSGVLIRLATDREARAVEEVRRGRGFVPEPERSYRLTEPDRPLAPDEVYVVGLAFVDFVTDVEQRWTAAEHHGRQFCTSRDATIELLAFADEVGGDGLIDLLGDMGIAGIGVSRWALMSAPRRIELSPELEARLAPLRRR